MNLMDRRRPGRPPLEASTEPRAAVHLKLTATDYDRIDRLARANRKSVQDVIRYSIKRLWLDERGGSI